MASLSYPRPQALPGRCCPQPLRSLIPLELPCTAVLPPLPSLQRHFLDTSYTLTTHLIPAAVPRTTPDAPLPDLPAWSADKEQWKASVSKTSEFIKEMRYEQWAGRLKGPGSRNQLWACVNRYLRSDLQEGQLSNGVTLFFAHANGFPKEIWEPTLSNLIAARQKTGASYTIDEIWIWEAVNHGDACLVNGDNLGGMCFGTDDWQDNARDVIQFLYYYLPPHSSARELPTHLPRQSEATCRHRELYGLRDRPLVGIGHSLGGCTIARAAVAIPKLFASLVLVDPIIRPHPQQGPLIPAHTMKLISGAVQRQSHWLSREDAREKFIASPFFSAWDSAVLNLYLECGLCDDGSGGVQLKMPGVHEALVFSETMTTFETWDLIDTLDPHVEIRWIIPENSQGESRIHEQMVWRRPENSSNTIIPSAGHLIAQEKPAELGKCS
ncbi:uncharacterized protein FIBRA_00481 [Fibroporia radiculosa]|uniref:AB hydrolase-1 domain-containing protein n=1 Tax=Fibroporia radiculosa TaxID=599839 RepID=J4G0A7_9APHY|nr:uncharacterized protein FIBRA_00481 [Fibroporia radiculosa]CCL98483.1 predicted protein [Fibroporia radiculosa]